MQSTKTILRSVGVATNYCRRLAQKQLKTYQCLCASRLYSTSAEIIPPPQAEGQPKAYPPKIEKIVQEISQLTLLEVADLNALLKKTLNIHDAPIMAMGAVAPAAVKEEEEEEEEAAAPRQEKMTYTVKLIKFDASKKLDLIRALKGVMPKLNLVMAKKFVESCPQVVKEEIPKDEAEQVKEALIAVGGEVEIE